MCDLMARSRVCVSKQEPVSKRRKSVIAVSEGWLRRASLLKV